MPQLRDSGTRSLHATEPVPSAEMDGFCRIFGVETEYGVAVTGAERPVDAGQVAMTMFQPIVSRSRSTNTYLTNGSRLYLDVGSHPEYATAEARDPREALAQDLALDPVAGIFIARGQLIGAAPVLLAAAKGALIDTPVVILLGHDGLSPGHARAGQNDRTGENGCFHGSCPLPQNGFA